jgi:hypothetical protein
MRVRPTARGLSAELMIDSREARYCITSQECQSLLCLLCDASGYVDHVWPGLTTALGLMFLQLLNLGPLFSLGWARAFARTPRGMFN